jgi:adenylosuccinate synthase
MNTILVGAQWGDEGKGKIVDVLTETHDAVIRSQGGNNAGHTVITGGRKYVLHLLPTGLLRPGKLGVIGNGCVVDPLGLVKELRGLAEAGLKLRGRLFISDRAHAVLPYHGHLDGLREESAGRKRIGTTRRGIGPAYQDKVARTGLRLHELLEPERWKARVKERLREINAQCRARGWKTVSAAGLVRGMEEAARVLAPHITDTVSLVAEWDRQGKSLLLEGAQGTFLDIDFGTYPYVTSSNTTSGGACTGTGLPPNRVDHVMGTMKAYTTRVGEGPFVTESTVLSDYLHGLGREFGATTGRARRCGWFDAVMTRYASRINGIDRIAITNLDGLDALEEIPVCTGYRMGRRTVETPPADTEAWAACRPVYRKFPGWKSDTSGCRTFRALPARARAYVRALADLTGGALAIVSVGARREQTLFL